MPLYEYILVLAISVIVGATTISFHAAAESGQWQHPARAIADHALFDDAGERPLNNARYRVERLDGAVRLVVTDAPLPGCQALGTTFPAETRDNRAVVLRTLTVNGAPVPVSVAGVADAERAARLCERERNTLALTLAPA